MLIKQLPSIANKTNEGYRISPLLFQIHDYMNRIKKNVFTVNHNKMKRTENTQVANTSLVKLYRQGKF